MSFRRTYPLPLSTDDVRDLSRTDSSATVRRSSPALFALLLGTAVVGARPAAAVPPMMASGITVARTFGIEPLASGRLQDGAANSAPSSPAPSTATAPPAISTNQATKVVLQYRAQAGQTQRLKGEVLLTAQDEGHKVTFDDKEVSKVSFTTVAPNGDITFDDLTEASQSVINGDTQKPDDPETDTFTIHPDGTLAAFVDGGPEPDAAHVNTRLYAATTPVFIKKAVGVGDKWSFDYAPNDALGLPKAHADFEIVGRETVANADTFKIQMSYAEDGTGTNITGAGTVWVEVTTGDAVKTDYTVDGVPFLAPEEKIFASGSITEERTEGGPLPASGKASDSAAAAMAAAGVSAPKKDKAIDDVVKGFEKMPGIVTLYRKQDGGHDTIYAELRDDQLGKLMMLEATASTGVASLSQISEGDPITDLMFEFVSTPDGRIVMQVPNTHYRADPTTPEGRSVRRSFTDSPIESFKVEGRQPERNSVLIDVSDLFRGNIAQVAEQFNPSLFAGRPQAGGYAIDRETTYVAAVKNFPDNLVITTEYGFIHGGAAADGDNQAIPDPRGAQVAITYNLFTLPNDPVTFAPTNGFKPRLYDPRIGYFTGADGAGGSVGANYVSLDDDSKPDPRVYYIDRWDLQKKDPAAAVSEPVQPIVFWLDNAIPTEYRAPMAAGILEWNKAFERLGFKNVIVVKQMPDNPDPKDTTVPSDTADMRFNVVRWASSPGDGLAVAQPRANPLTGQILHASITVDSSWAHYTQLQYMDMISPAEAFVAGEGLSADRAEIEHHAGAAAASLVPGFSAAQPRAVAGADSRFCQFGAGMMKQAWMGDLALSLTADGADGFSPTDRKAFVAQLLKAVVMHESGHCLGLRHNFAGSTEFSLQQLADPKLTAEHGLGASIMDYAPFNISALHHKGVPFFTPTIGTYDYWAIQYGYMSVPGATSPDAETPALERVASESTEPGHAYASDEVANSFDPQVSAYDLSSDPLAYWQRNLDLSRYLIANLDKRLPKPGDSYWQFTRAFYGLLNNYADSAVQACRYIGGLNYSRNHRGDKHERPVLQPVDVTKQRQALALLNTYMFAPDALQFPLRYYSELTENPRVDDVDTFPISDDIATLQQVALHRLFSAPVLDRVSNNEFKEGGDPKKALRLVDLFGSVHSNVWSEVDAHRNVSSLRRQLQASFVDTMIEMATAKPSSMEESYGAAPPADARMLAWDQLRQMRSSLQSAIDHPAPGVTYDAYTKIHLDETLARVNRALSASLNIGGSSGTMSLMQLLGAQTTPGNGAP